MERDKNTNQNLFLPTLSCSQKTTYLQQNKTPHERVHTTNKSEMRREKEKQPSTETITRLWLKRKIERVVQREREMQSEEGF